MTVQKIMVKKNHTVKSYDINHGFLSCFNFLPFILHVIENLW